MNGKDAPWSSMMFVASGIAMCGLGVVLGAVGAHVFGQVMDAVELETYKTGVLYQLIHGLALIATGMLSRQIENWKPAVWGGWFFLAGIPLFCFSLYGLALFDAKFLGAIAPVGGSCFIAGWGCLFWAAQRGWKREG